MDSDKAGSKVGTPTESELECKDLQLVISRFCGPFCRETRYMCNKYPGSGGHWPFADLRPEILYGFHLTSLYLDWECLYPYLMVCRDCCKFIELVATQQLRHAETMLGS